MILKAATSTSSLGSRGRSVHETATTWPQAGQVASAGPSASLWVTASQAQIAAVGGADRRSAEIADAPMNQSREAHLAARPLHSPEGG